MYFIRLTIRLVSLSDDERVVLRLNASDNAQPAGIDADTNGYLYVGSYGGGHVMKIDPM